MLVVLHNNSFSGSHILNKFPATIHGAGSGQPDEDGLRQPGDGVRAQLPALHLAGPARHPGERAQGDDLPQDPHHQPGHRARARPAVTNPQLSQQQHCCTPQRVLAPSTTF